MAYLDEKFRVYKSSLTTQEKDMFTDYIATAYDRNDIKRFWGVGDTPEKAKQELSRMRIEYIQGRPDFANHPFQRDVAKREWPEDGKIQYVATVIDPV